jgi:hypothetical protein
MASPYFCLTGNTTLDEIDNILNFLRYKKSSRQDSFLEFESNFIGIDKEN